MLLPAHGMNYIEVLRFARCCVTLKLFQQFVRMHDYLHHVRWYEQHQLVVGLVYHKLARQAHPKFLR